MRAVLVVATALAAACAPGSGDAEGGLDVPWSDATIVVGQVERVVPANATAVDVVTELVGPERVAALPATALVYSRLADDAAAWAHVPRFARYEAEALLALDPDLVLCDALQADATTDVLRGAGVPVLRAPSDEGWDAIDAYVLFVARLLDAEPAGRALVDDVAARRARLAERTAVFPDWTAVTYTNSGTGGWTAGSGTSADALLAAAGLANAAAAHGVEGHAPLDYETLITWDPDVIVVSRSHDGASSPTADLLRREPALASLRAVRRDRIVTLPPSLYSTVSHRLVDASEAVVDALEPHVPTTSERR